MPVAVSVKGFLPMAERRFHSTGPEAGLLKGVPKRTCDLPWPILNAQQWKVGRFNRLTREVQISPTGCAMMPLDP